MILEVLPFRDGNGKELRRLHDVVQQHLRALKAMEYEPSGHFITSALELKLDVDTMFEWQKHSQSSTKVPHYRDNLSFINLRAHSNSDQGKKPSKNDHHSARKPSAPGRSLASFAANADSVAGPCVVCKMDSHPLYACTKFKNLPHDAMVGKQSLHELPEAWSLYPAMQVATSMSKMPEATSHVAACGDERRACAGSTSCIHLASEFYHVPYCYVTQANSLLMTCRVLVGAPDGT